MAFDNNAVRISVLCSAVNWQSSQGIPFSPQANSRLQVQNDTVNRADHDHDPEKDSTVSGLPAIIDSHIHFWDPVQTQRAVSSLVRLFGFSPRLVNWVCRRAFPKDALEFYASPEFITAPYLPVELISDTAGCSLEGVVHVEAGWNDSSPLGPVAETIWLNSLDQSDSPLIRGIVARVDFSIGKSCGDTIRAHLEAGNRVRGIRDIVSWHSDRKVLNGCVQQSRMLDTAWLAGFEQLCDFNLLFEATCYHNQLEDLYQLAARFSDQTFVLDHIGTPVAVGGPFADQGKTVDERRAIYASWSDSLSKLAELPNIVVKLSGLTMPVLGFGYQKMKTAPSQDQLCNDLGPLVSRVLRIWGPDRCLFGSNFPVDKVSLSYAALIEALLSLTASYSGSERELLFSANTARVYQLNDME